MEQTTQGVRHDQPFYYALPDELDCMRLFAGVRVSKYVAQENLEPLPRPQRVVHRAINAYFTAFAVDSGRCVPALPHVLGSLGPLLTGTAFAVDSGRRVPARPALPASLS